MIAGALGVNELSGQSLARLLGARRVLLVLDNLEHLPEVSQHVAGVLHAGPDVVVLATSRAPLRLSTERTFEVPPLPGDDAVALFVERAQAVAGPEIAEICRQLDGLPLAIELAAAQASVLPPTAILARLEQRLALLTRGPRDVSERQRTLRATIEWSVDLLDDDARLLFARLSVFAGGFTLDAAEAICGDVLEPLATLVDHSLLRRSGERFSMLETIREFAKNSLAESAEEVDLRERHAAYFIALAETAYAGRLEAETRWADAIESELDNLRAALDWIAAGSARSLQLAGALGWFFHLHSHLAEGRERLTAALTHADGDPRHRACALAAAGTIAGWTGDLGSAREPLESAIASGGSSTNRSRRRSRSKRSAGCCSHAEKTQNRCGDSRRRSTFNAASGRRCSSTEPLSASASCSSRWATRTRRSHGLTSCSSLRGARMTCAPSISRTTSSPTAP
jgi:predicted ATPase